MKLYAAVLILFACLAGTAQGEGYLYRVESFALDATFNKGCIHDMQEQFYPRTAVGNMFNATGAVINNPRGLLIDVSPTSGRLLQTLLPLSTSATPPNNKTPAPSRSVALGINTNGQIVGFTEDNTFTTYQPLVNFFGFLQKGAIDPTLPPRPARIAAIWLKNAQPQLIGPQNSGRESIARDINDAGIAVGDMQIDNTTTIPSRDFYQEGYTGITPAAVQIRHAVRWEGTTAQELTLPGSPSNVATLESTARAINNTGSIVGYFEVAESITENRTINGTPLTLTRNKIRAFLWENGVATDLPIPAPYVESDAWDINDGGTIVGYVTDAGNLPHAVLWEKSTTGSYQMQLLETGSSLVITESAARSINKNGFVAGYFINDKQEQRMFIYDNKGLLRDVNALISPDYGGYALYEAYVINDQNEMGGCGGNLSTKTPVIARPITHDLQLTISTSPDPVTVGNRLIFNIPVRNYFDTAQGFQLNAQLQGSFDFITAHQRITLVCSEIPDQYLPVTCTDWITRCSTPKTPPDPFCNAQPKLLVEIPCTFADNNVNCGLKTLSANRINHVSIMVEPQKAGKISINAIASTVDTEREFDVSNNQARLDARVDACFIATAAYGSLLVPEVRTLRHFRDSVLAHLPGGPQLIQGYYATSPPLAHFIGQHSWAKWLTQAILYGVIFMIKFPWLVLSLLLTRWWLNTQHTYKIS